jgi:hypothetical protein
MGLCCSCCGSSEGSEENETELQVTNAEANKKCMVISTTMSAPTVKIADSTIVSGSGLALVGIPIEQDAAYWEWQVLDVEGSNGIGHSEIMFGVTSKKDKTFYGSTTTKKAAANAEAGDGTDQGNDDTHHDDDESGPTSPSEKNGTQWMRAIEVQKDDVIGVAVQQSDLPMVQFLLNGEPLHDCAINRFRATVYPALYVPSSIPQQQKQNVKVKLVMLESEFKQMSPNAKFGPVIVARSIV